MANAVQLFPATEQLQRSLAALVIANPRIRPKLPQAVAAVFSQADHPALVHAVTGCRAVAQHREDPPPHGRIE